MDEFVMTNIYTHVRDFPAREPEKDQIPRLQVAQGNRTGCFKLAIRCAGQVDPGAFVGVVDQATTIEALLRGTTAIVVWGTEHIAGYVDDLSMDACRARSVYIGRVSRSAY